MLNKKTYRGGMIGAGAWSEHQLNAWQNVENAKIVAFCDRHPEKRDPIANKFKISQVFDDFEAMLDSSDLDFVDICVQPYSHSKLIKLAVERKLPILCQKPFCTSMEEAREMVDLCEYAKLPLMINENYRWEPWYRKAKELLQKGEIGKPFLAKHHIRVRFTLPSFSSGQSYFAKMPRLVGYEMGPHYFDTCRYLFGEPESIYARMHSISPHVKGEDVMLVLLNYKEMTCEIDTSWASVPIAGIDRAKNPRSNDGFPHILEIDGTKGTMIVGPDAILHLYTDDDHRQYELPPESMRLAMDQAQQHFIDCLETGNEFETSGKDNLKTMSWVYNCYKSAENNIVVTSDKF